MSQLAAEVAESSGAPQGPLGEPEVEGKSPGQLFWARFKQDKVALGGVFVIFVLVLIAIFGGPLAERISGHDPNDVFKEAFQYYGELKIPGPAAPSSEFLLGADTAG